MSLDSSNNACCPEASLFTMDFLIALCMITQRDVGYDVDLACSVDSYWHLIHKERANGVMQ